MQLLKERYIIKRNGQKEKFDVSKIIKWEKWAANGYEDIDLKSITLKVLEDLPETFTTQDIQLKIIEECKNKKGFNYMMVAGRLYAAFMRKKIFNLEKYNVPVLKDLHRNLIKLDYMRELNYTDEEYDYIEKNIIDHTRDFNLSYFQVYQIVHKFALSNRIDKISFETPQFVFIRMAMALSENEENKLTHVKKFYDYFSLNKINAPTPNYINLGTNHRGFISCCLYKVDDNVKSLSIGDHIAYTMTYMSSGIGSFLNTRSVNDKVKKGLIKHQGKLSYFKSLAAAVNANLQGGRGGACTAFFLCYDPEVETIVNIQNPRTPLFKQNRDLHFAFMFNDFFIEKVIKNEDIFLFNAYTAPDLIESFFDKDSNKFREIYEKYEKDDNFEKKYLNARKLALSALRQCHEVATLYLLNINEVNRHTSFKDKIYQSNLCMEILQPTIAYNDMLKLYSEEKHEDGEISLCALGGIVTPNISSDEEYEDVAYYTLKMIDYCIDNNFYVFPHLKYTATSRRNAGVGIIGLAYELARNGYNYSSEESYKYMHYLAERHSYFLIKASLRLGKEKGNAPWIHKTKWPDGWLPIDDYNKNVNTITNFEYKYDWESLRNEIIENKGIRNSSLVAHMPTESSSKASGMPNGLYPIRSLYLVKTDSSNTVDWLAYESDKYENSYDIAWDVPLESLIKTYAIFQKFADQGISADFYIDRTKYEVLKASRLFKELLLMHKYGIKTRYYTNSKTTDSVTLDDITGVGCSSGACTL